MIYRRWTPHPRLAPHVECLWYLRRSAPVADAPDRILPDGRMELIFNLRTPFGRVLDDGRTARQPSALLFGQLSRFILLQPATEVEVLAVRFKPAGASAFFRHDLGELSDCHVDLDQLGHPWRELAAQLADAPTLAARLRVLETTLLRHLSLSRDAARIAAALDLLQPDPDLAPPRIAHVARQLGLSPRHLERTFRREVGLTPKLYTRLLRFRRMFAALDRADPRWADLAVRAGYSDQPHLVREFRDFTGLSPRACLTHQTAFASALLE